MFESICLTFVFAENECITYCKKENCFELACLVELFVFMFGHDLLIL